MMNLKEYDVISLLVAFPEYGLMTGTKGTVIHSYSGCPDLAVEFVTPNGVIMLDLRPDEIKPEPFINHMTRIIVLGTNNSREMTFENWLKEDVLPKGFDKMIHGYPYWDQGMPLGWAIYQFEKKQRSKPNG